MAETDHRGTVATGAGMSLIGRGISLVLGLFYRRYLNVLFGPVYTGLFILCFNIVNFFSPLAQFGIPRGVARYIAIARQRKDWGAARGALIGGIQIAGIATLIVVALLYFFTPEIVDLFAKVRGKEVTHTAEMCSVLRVYAFFLFPTILLAVVLSAQRAFRNIWTTFSIEYVYIPVMWLAAVLAVGYTMGTQGAKGISVLIGVFIAIATGALIISIWAFRWVAPQLRGARPTFARKEMLSFSAPLVIQSALKMFIHADTIMVGFFLGFTTVTVYNFAITLAKQSGVVRDAFGSLFTPLVAGIHDSGDLTQLEKLYQTTTRWCVMCAVPLICIQMIVPDLILHFLGIVNKPDAYTVVRMVAVAQLLSILIGTSGQVLIMTGHPKLSMINNIISVILNIALNLYLIPRYGILGAAFATAIAIIVKNCADILEIRLLLKITPFSLSMIPVILCCIAASGATLLTRYFTRGWSWWQALLISGAVFGLVYVPSLVVIMNKEDKEFFKGIIARIRRK